MPIAQVHDLLGTAEKANTSVIAFDAYDHTTICAVIRGAEKAKRPVIAMLHPSCRSLISFRLFVETVKDIAQRAAVPVGLHLDHCSDFTTLMEAIRDGFTSVMADGSLLPFEENVRFTRSVAEVARVFGVDVEGELGHVGTAAQDSACADRNSYTLPEEAARFAELTGATSLAVSFGSSHGVYRAEPKLDMERLREINAATGTPLVLHGGSGIPEDQLKEAFSRGINKFNVATEFLMLYDSLRKGFYTDLSAEEQACGCEAYVLARLTDYIAEKVRLCSLTV